MPTKISSTPATPATPSAPSAPVNPASVFVSYAHEDEKRARQIIRFLEQAGFSVWWDGLLGGGERFSPTIEAALDHAVAVVVLWSKASVASHWVQDEAARGRDRRRLVPLTIDGTEPPLGFRQYHVIDVSNLKGRRETPDVQALIRAITALRDQPPPAPTPPPAAIVRGIDRRALLGGGAALAVAGAVLAAWKTGLFAPEAPTSASVAVLPFTNISGDADQTYFSDGMAAELRADLARNPLLQVVGQTSSETFRDHKDDAKSIARKLSVAFLLDGNVRRSGDTVRIVPALINGRTGFQTWTNTFDRPIKDVFAVQSEIAGAVAEALSAAVAGSAPQHGVADPPTQIGGTRSVAAFDAFLRGKDLFALGSDESDRAALPNFDQAIAIDPNYGAAHAARSRVLTVIANQFAQVAAERRDMYDTAVTAANTAVALAPQLADAFSALGFALFYGRLDVRGARAPFYRSHALGGGDADVLSRFALYCSRTGRRDEARSAVAKAAALDPLNPYVFRTVGAVAYAARRFAESIPPLERALALNSRMGGARAAIGMSEFLLGKLDDARQSFTAERSGLFGLTGIAITAHAQGRETEAKAALTRLIQENGDNSQYQQAQIYAQWGDRSKAVGALLAARSSFDAGLSNSHSDPLLDPLRQDPDFIGLQKELGFE